MLLDVKPILRDPSTRLPFRFSMDLSDLEFSGRYPVSREVTVEGEAYSSADVLHLDLTARTTLDAVCDRCGKAFSQDKEVPYSWPRSFRTRTTMRSCCWSRTKWMWASWPAPRSFSEWTPKLCVRKIAKDCAPGVVLI